MADNMSNIQIIVSIDDDDNMMDTYSLKIHPNVTVCKGSPNGKVDAINRDIPDPATFDILLLASDDMIPIVKGYDTIIRDSMKQFYPDSDGVLFFNDGFQESKLNTLVICGSKYYQRFGYIYHPDYKSLYCDNEFTDQATRLGKQTYFHQVIIRHEHPYNLKTNVDDLYWHNDTFMNVDRATYERRFIPIYDVSVLICTIPSRNTQLTTLLNDIEKFKKLTSLNIEILVDNRTDIPTGTKRNDLLFKARGKYSCFIDDDDKITRHYFKVIQDAIITGDYDCISLNGRYYINGIYKGPFYHSTKHSSWWSDNNGYYRTPNHLNPIRTTICNQIRYKDITHGEDHEFSNRLYDSRLIKSEYFHDYVQYLYYSVQKLEEQIHEPKKNIAISFSLYGNVDNYMDGLIDNCRIINSEYPEYFIYVYTGNDFDHSILSQLNDFKNIKIIQTGQSGHVNRCYRFFTIDDENIDIAFSRDADSRVNKRDMYCINKFIESNISFQIIRDHPYHNVPICAGMWGIKRGCILDKIKVLFDRYTAKDNSESFDQKFLADVIYEKVKHNAIVFDEFVKYPGEYCVPIEVPHETITGTRDFVGRPIPPNTRQIIYDTIVENTGQVKVDCRMGQWISNYAANPKYSRYLEIGTWNGRGSTCCFYDGFKKRTDEFTLHSYEINKQRFREAKSTWEFYPRINIVNGTIMKLSEYPSLEELQKIHPDNIVSEWYNDDISSLNTCNYIPPLEPDVVLLDGSEYFTHFEGLKLLRDTNASVFILDDTLSKCKVLFQWFKSNTEWNCIDYSDTERNGWAVFEIIKN